MKQNYLFLCFLVIYLTTTLSSQAQEIKNAQWISRDTSATPLHIIAYWNKGDVKKYRARKLSYQYLGDSLISQKTEFDAIVQFQVIDSTEQSYNLEYRMIENKRDLSNDPTLPYEALNLSEDDLTLYYTTDETGAMEGYKNREMIERGLDKMMKEVVNGELKKKSYKDEAEKKLTESLASKLANGKVLFDNVYHVFVSQFHTLHGYATGINDTLNFTESVPGLIGDKTIDLNCYLYVTSIDTTSYEVRYDVEKYADLNEFMNGYAKSLQETAKEAGVKPTTDLQNQLEKMDMKVEAYSSHYIDMGSGWPTFIKVTRLVTAKDLATQIVSTKEEIWALDTNLEDSN
ncbi:hypothetical protein [Telluribacter humicola]|uniref:hypothetical protein n=1 Tax=Telluribacter humicola TaxID=1720261 RepID=UPI001A976FB7|nr:hypothetical protein [Telluribacter humicola]